MPDAPAIQSGSRRDDAPDVVGWVVFGLVAICVYMRLYFSVDFTDEAYYVALPYSFALGHQPLVDESAVHQLAGLMLLPLVELFLALADSASGIVLFARHLYFAAAVACALLARNYFAAIFDARTGALVAAVALAYVPFHIPSLSYNTIAYLGLFAGTISFATASLPGRHMAHLLVGTLAMAAASFAYPSIVLATVPGVAFGLAGVWLRRDPAVRRLAIGLVATAGTASATIGLYALIRHGAKRELSDLIELDSAMAKQGGGLIKLNELAGQFGLEWQYLSALVLVLAIVFLCYRMASSSALTTIAVSLLGPALFFIAPLYVKFREPYTTVPFILSAVALASPLVLRALRHTLTPAQWWGLASVTATSLLAGATIIWSTANGLRNGPLGFLPATLVTVAGLSLLRSSKNTVPPVPSPSWVFTLLVVSSLTFQVFSLWTETYRDWPMYSLSAKVEHGPWKGIHTSPPRKQFIENLQNDLEGARGEAKTILFFDYFPGGYLLSDLRPRTPALWMFPSFRGLQGNASLRPIYAQHFDDGLPLPDLVVRMSCIPQRTLVDVNVPADDVFDQRIFQGDYERVAKRRCYELFKKHSEPSPILDQGSS